MKTARQVCKGVATLEPKEEENALEACHADAREGRGRALVLQGSVGTCPGVARWSATGTGQTARDRGVRGAGARTGPLLSEVSPRVESGAVVEVCDGPSLPRRGGGDVWDQGAGEEGDRRYPRTVAGGQEQS